MSDNSAIHNTSSNDENQLKKSNKYEPKTFRNGFHMVRVFEVLHSLRQDDVLCDIWLQTDDGTLVSGHKVILVSACPYFSHRFNEIKTNLFHLKELDSTALNSTNFKVNV